MSAFTGRVEGGVPSGARDQLDLLQKQYGSNESEMVNAWDALALSNPDWNGQLYPNNDSMFSALRRELESAAARRRKSREVLPVSTLKTPFKNPSMVTPPANKKRTSDISPPSLESKKQLTMDQLSTVSTFNSIPFAYREFRSAAVVPDIIPVGEWTSRWLGTGSKESFMFMHSTLDEISRQLRQDMTEFGEDALKHHRIKYPSLRGSEEDRAGVEVDEFASGFDKVGACMQVRNVLLCGRICCDSDSGKLNAKSILLEGINGIKVKLDMDGYKDEKVSLFPGQYVIVEGLSLGSTRIRAEKIYTGCAMPPPRLAESQDFRLWVASGPFTSPQDLKFELLDVLLAQTQKESPDYLILMGPYVDANHTLISSGRPSVEVKDASGRTQNITDVGFEDVLGFFLQRILTGLKDVKTRVILVPSSDDVVHPVPAFPQPNLEIPSDLNDPRFISLPNPASFSIGGVAFGVANIDTLFDFQEEGTAAFHYDPKENMQRLVSHMVMQRSFYPIVPPAAESSVDLFARDNFKMEPVDVVLTPSKLQSFAVDIGGVLCVNPGKSVTMRTKMTVARMEFRASEGIVTDDNGVKRGMNVAQNRSKVEFYTVG